MTLKRVTFLCFQDGAASTVAGPYEVLKYAAAHAKGGSAKHALEISIVTPQGTEAVSEGFIAVWPSTSIESTSQSDLVFVTGLAYGRDPSLDTDPRLCAWLSKQYAGGAVIAAVCAGQALLAAAGLLDGRAAAIHWSLLDAFKARWPAARWSADRLVVADQGLYTSCGATSAIDLTLFLVDHFFGLDTMMDCARWFVADLPRLRPHPPPPIFSPPQVADDTMRKIEARLYAHFNETIRFETLAAEFGMSWRTFQRRFQVTFGESPKVYLQKLRLAAAQHLLEDELLTVDQVAVRVGYDNPAFFRSLFRRHFAMTPSDYRKAFRFQPIHSPGSADREPRPR